MIRKKITYLLLKILGTFWHHHIKKFSIKNAIVCKNLNINNIKSVGFYLDNKTLVHIGDHLFFEPIIKFFEKNNIDTYVCTSEIMSNYFKFVGHKITNKKNILECDLVIAPIQLAIYLRKEKNNNVVFLDTYNLLIQEPISNYFINRFIEILQIKDTLEHKNEYVISKINSKNFILDNNKKWFIFSDNVDSGFLKINKSYRSVLIKEARRKIKNGYNIAIVGTQNDLIKKQEYTEFENYDIRGKTNVVQLFEIFNCEHVLGSISFDTAIAHISILYKKEAIIKLRRNFDLNNKFIKRCILPSYKRINNIIKYV